MLNVASVGPYTLKGIIGQGAFGTVVLASNTDPNGMEINLACKIVARSDLAAAHMEARFENEIRIMQQLKHPGVIQIVDLFKDHEFYYILMEYCEGGELFRYIVSHPDGRVPEEEGKIFMRQILQVLQHFHNLGVCHRDLKPENILLDLFGHVKIGDFGFSRFVRRDGLVETACGSPVYSSPECISGKPYDGRRSDIWSSGVILFAMLTGTLPWTKRNQAQLFDQIRRGEFTVPSFLSPLCKDLIKGLMTVDSGKRMTIEEALIHPWFADTLPCLSERPWVFVTPSLRRVDRFFQREVSTTSVVRARRTLPRSRSAPKLTDEQIEDLIWEIAEEEDEDEHESEMIRQWQRPVLNLDKRVLVSKTTGKLAVDQ